MRPWRLTKLSYYLDFAIYPPVIVALALVSFKSTGLSLAWLQWPVLGFIAWTLVEYWLHRIIFHGVPPAIAELHALHHSNPSAFIGVPVWYSVLFFLAFSFPILALLGSERGIGIIIGLLTGYTLYIGIHDAAHHPSSYLRPWFSRLRVKHLRHHYRNAHAGFGVTTDIWDRLFGTRAQE
jgi:sterol desaturase/sphingolipid hydroxylase (fatty acid hydroxylase superfamily)